MKKIIFLLILFQFFLFGCTIKSASEEDNNSVNENIESNSIDLGTKKEIKSKIYIKYLSSFNNNEHSEDSLENQGNLEIEKVDKNRKIFRGNGRYLNFLTEESKFYIDYYYDKDNFVLSYIIFKDKSHNDTLYKEDVIIELIKNDDNVRIKQENINGEEINLINFDENKISEIIDNVKNLVTNSLFNN